MTTRSCTDGTPSRWCCSHSLNYCRTSQSVCSAQLQVENKLVNHCQWCSSKTLYTEISLELFFIAVHPFSMGRIHFLFKCARWGQDRGWKEDEGLISWCPVWNIQYTLFFKVRITLFSSLHPTWPHLTTPYKTPSPIVCHSQASHSKVPKLCIQLGKICWVWTGVWPHWC